MINWRKVTEMEPKPGHNGYVLLLDNVENKVFCGWRRRSGEFYDNRDPEWWAPLNLPGEDCDETGDEKEDRVVALERRVAALENAREVTAATGWAVVDEEKRLEQALREIIATYRAAAGFTGLYERRLCVLAEASRNMAHIASGAINDQ